MDLHQYHLKLHRNHLQPKPHNQIDRIIKSATQVPRVLPVLVTRGPLSDIPCVMGTSGWALAVWSFMQPKQGQIHVEAEVGT